MADAYIGLGSNLGDRQAVLLGALERLRQADGIQVLAASAFHETEPVGGPPGQGMFLNGAAHLRVCLTPWDLLGKLSTIEAAFGRVRQGPWGPRTLDLDLLLYDDLVIQTDRLTVPHPRMHERRFVLGPLAEIAPHVRHPLLARTVAELLAELDDRAAE